MIKRTKIALITGVAGFIGSHLAENLVKEGWQVHGVDNFQTGKMENLLNCWGKHNFHFTECNILNIKEYTFVDEFNHVINDFDVVFHLAARPKVGYSVDYPLETNKNNIGGTLEVLEWAKRKAKRLVFASSSSVYGGRNFKMKEEIKCTPRSPYALHKLMGEEYCRLYSSLYGLDTVSLRFFNVYGTRMDPKSDYANLVPKHLRLAKKNKPLPVYGDGEQIRSFVYVDDVVSGLIKAGNKKGKFSGEVYNLGWKQGNSVNDVDRVIGEVLKKKVKQQFLPAKAGESRYSLCNIEKAHKYLDWSPTISLRQGIKRIINNY